MSTETTTTSDDIEQAIDRRLAAAGLDPDELSENGQAVVPIVVSGIRDMIPYLHDDAHGLRVMAECLRAYGDLCDAHAATLPSSVAGESR